MDILNLKIKIVRRLMHILLGFNSTSNKYVIKCSQHLDTLIVKSQLDLINKKKNKNIHYNFYPSTSMSYGKKNKESLREVS
ncbi:aspartyl-phosphate phosphatase Spo0E family protein [Alloiococcus sp. CFN-8]|uniref:aspartyl-phosphate phosphatase Spo0E family protein n=1 Tax=Alloiococcus sp. CFN-8 TaxID=3416081 RepID=UPI003CE8A924